VEAAVIARVDQGPGLLFFLLFALDEFNDVGMLGVQDDHLGRAARLAAGLDHAGEGVVALHERKPGLKRFRRRPKIRGCCAGAKGWCPRPSRP